MNTQNPYMQMTDLTGGANPMVQNTSAQQQMYQQNMSNMGNLANQALDTKGTQIAKFDNKSMADALRAGQNPQQPAPVIDNSTMSPDAYQEMMQKYYGNAYDPNAGWSA
jgi:hypothetical protein